MNKKDVQNQYQRFYQNNYIEMKYHEVLNAKQGIKILSETVKVLKNPFQDEDKKLEELSSLTDKFKEKDVLTKNEISGEKNA
ncbi:MAG: hypothetical protein HGB14_07120 [Anaerolineaceae bacterium]|nr:hypothetical protein [Anaerolineaceae bacterium]